MSAVLPQSQQGRAACSVLVSELRLKWDRVEVTGGEPLSQVKSDVILEV